MKAFLHIGIGKTATSSIQKCLDINSDVLESQGFRYPRAFAMGKGSQRSRQLKLGAYARDDEILTDTRKVLKVKRADLPAFRASVEEDLAQEVADLPAGVDALVMSDEGLCNLAAPEELELLRDLIATQCSDIKVVVYIRRQDQHSVSQHSQHIKAGRIGKKILRDTRVYQYDALLDLWAEVFGAENIIPRVFERGHFVNGDVIDDFLHVCGMDPEAGFEKPGMLNESLSPVGEAFLMRLNASFRKFEGEDHNTARSIILGSLLELYAGKGLKPSRAAAEAFYERYANVNERVRRRWFPGQESLFDMDFSSYPEEDQESAFSLDELMEVAAGLSQKISEDCVSLISENRKLKRKLVRHGLMSPKAAGLEDVGDGLGQARKLDA